MRLKLVLSFAAVVLVSILTFTWLMRQETARQVRMYMFRGSLDSDASLTEVLEEYYLQTGSWENVASILGTEMRGQGQMGGMRAGGGPRSAHSFYWPMLQDRSYTIPAGRMSGSGCRYSSAGSHCACRSRGKRSATWSPVPHKAPAARPSWLNG